MRRVGGLTAQRHAYARLRAHPERMVTSACYFRRQFP